MSSSMNKTNASDLLKHFFLEIRDTRKDSLGEEYEPSTLSTYRNGLRRYFLERKDGDSFDIGEDEDLKKKLAAKKKQLKAEGKGNRPHRADPLDENQMEKLWTTGAVVRVVEQHQNVRYERPTRTPQLQSPRLQRPGKLL